MIPFLSKFLRNFPAIQTKQILNLLSEARDKGELVSSKDLKEHLDQLAEVISEEELKIRAPFLFFQDGDVLESDALSTFIKMVQLDTEACLGEVENIGNSIRAHHKVLVDNYFNSIESSIVELEKKVSAYELLSKHRARGFNRVFSFSFDGGISVPGASANTAVLSNNAGDKIIKGGKESGNYSETGPDTAVRSEQVTAETSIRTVDKSLFSDTRGGQELYWSPSHYGDLGLSLASENTYHKFLSASLIPDTGTASSVIRNDEANIVSGNHIFNILDDDPDTYWSHSIKTSDPTVTSCQIKLLLNFPSTRRINALSINPVSDYQMILTNVSYLSSGGREVEVVPFTYQYPDGVELPANSKVIVDVGDFSAQGVLLTFKQPKADKIQETYTVEPSGNFRNLKPEEITGFDGVISFPDSEEIDPKYLNYMNYSFGFKDILGVEKVYKPNGLFVSQKKKTNVLKTLSLDTLAFFPSYDLTDVEINIKKENYLKGIEKPVDIEFFPVFVLNTENLNERLFLNERTSHPSSNDTGLLRFYPDFFQNFKVYENTKELRLGIDYEITVDNGQNWENTSTFTGTREQFAKCKVRILNPRTDKIFTVSYKPLISAQETGGEVYLNAEKTVRLERNQTYVFKTSRTEGEIHKTHLTLQIICRANTLNQRVTPYLSGVRMLCGVGSSNG